MPENIPAVGFAPSFIVVTVVVPETAAAVVVIVLPTLPKKPPEAKLLKPAVLVRLLPKLTSPEGFAWGGVLLTVRSTEDESTFCSKLVRAGRGAFVAGSTGPKEGGKGLSFCADSSTDGRTFSFAEEEAVTTVFGWPKLSDPSDDVPRLNEIPVPPPDVAADEGRSKEKFGFAREPNVSPD